MGNVFVYGTLMFREVVIALTKRDFVMKSAVLRGYKRFRVNNPKREQKGPAIVEQSDGEVKGKVLLDVDEATIRILDKFEGSSYEKRNVSVFVNGEKISAVVYVGTSFKKEALRGDWDEEEFRQKYLDFYIKERIPKIIGK